MKNNMLKILFVLFVGFSLFSSCIKKENGADAIVKTPAKTSELNVPNGFKWETSMNVPCDFQSTNNVSTRVSLSLESGGDSFATFYVGGGAETVSIALPTYAEEVFVSYDTETGKSKAEKLVITSGKLSYTVPSDAKVYVDETPTPRRLARGVTRANDQEETITYPATGWGTVLFEDLFPSYGDYDFNDVVVGYQIQLYPNNKNKVKEMLIGVLVRAQGGSLPYEIYLRMLGVKGGEVDEIEIVDSRNVNSDFDVVAMNSANPVKDPSILKFVNMRQMNVGYVNTIEGQTWTEERLVKVLFHVILRNSVSIEPIGQNDYGLSAESFDFFIAKQENENQKEIHICGSEPALSFDFNDKIRKEHANTSECKDFYLSNSNLVWGINIPAAVSHPYEKIDIMYAYPDFAKWVESGGKSNKNWYKNKVNEKVVNW